MLSEERELAKTQWQAELDRRVEEYFGSHVYFSLRDGYISDLIELKTCLTEREYSFIMPALRKAALDYEKIINHGWNESALVGLHYPRTIKIENGNGHEKRQGLIQIFV